MSWNRSKVVIVGERGAGKTSLLKMLRDLSFESSSADTSTQLTIATVKVHDSDIILSLYDFGEQSLLPTVQHFFFTPYGVYVVVFNMMNILNESKREQSLSELLLWINNIGIHARGASVFLVGTHEDLVFDKAVYDRISEIMQTRFRYSVTWPSIVEYNMQCFFPVNSNNRTQLENNSNHKHLMNQIVNKVMDAEYMTELRPISWRQTLDKMVKKRKSTLTLNKVSRIARRNQVKNDDLFLFLSFLNNMGEVLWLDETGLRDVVVMDINKFLVEPASLLLNHKSQSSDSTLYHRSTQEICCNKYPREWDLMTIKGIVGQELMKYLVGRRVQPSDVLVVINIMLYFGLIVKLEQCQHSTSHLYLVPALLPTKANSTIFRDDAWNVNAFLTCYFVFSTRSEQSHIIPLLQLRNECFLPTEMMERLIGKVVKWCHLPSIASIFGLPVLYQNYALLSYRSQRYRLISLPVLNCIRLDIEGEHPLPVHYRIQEQIKECVDVCGGSHHFITALRLGEVSESEDLAAAGLFSSVALASATRSAG